MGRSDKCMMCSLPAGLCENCRYNTDKKCATNALPRGFFLNNGRYRIERVLGEGGYGITYEATDLQKRCKVAVKEFFPAYALYRNPNGTDVISKVANAETALAHTRMRFNQEAALLISLKSIKEIVTVYHSFEDNKTAYYTMELLQGMDMQKWLQKHGAMHWNELYPIVIQILRALYATHQMGYIHRDVTPDNIYILQNGTAQLIDFGNARRYNANQQLTAVVKDKFAPREQYTSKGKQGPWTDIYSLCVTIYYALTGKLPPKATEVNAAGDMMPPLHTLVDVPQAVSRAVQVGMSADENKRYQSIADFAYAMFPGKAILGELTRQISPQQTYQRDTRDRNQRVYNERRNATMPVQQQSENRKQQIYRQTERSGSGSQPMLVCSQGIMKGFRINLPAGQIQTIGRGHGKMIQYPDNSGGVSRNQCSIMLHTNGMVYVRDDGSSYGTLINGQRLVPGAWQPLKRGSTVTFGREAYILY